MAIWWSNPTWVAESESLVGEICFDRWKIHLGCSGWWWNDFSVVPYLCKKWYRFNILPKTIMKQNGVDTVSTIHWITQITPTHSSSFCFPERCPPQRFCQLWGLIDHWPVSVPRGNSRTIFAELPHEDFQAIQAGNLGRSKVEHRHQKANVDNPVPRNNVYMVDQRTCWYTNRIQKKS